MPTAGGETTPTSGRPILMGRGIMYGSYGRAVWKTDGHGAPGLTLSGLYGDHPGILVLANGDFFFLPPALVSSFPPVPSPLVVDTYAQRVTLCLKVGNEEM